MVQRRAPCVAPIESFDQAGQEGRNFSAARPRLLPVHPRRDPGPGHRHPGHHQNIQIIDGLEDEYKKKFYLHYNFPGYSVGECKPNRGPGRREIGHGMLAERSISRGAPLQEENPYTVRVVSEITESNGSISMATICGGTLALMDAGIKLKAPVAGVAMGLVSDGDKFVVLSDIAGQEDHYGDMDFKVAGTEQGITALQMDIKIGGITTEILTKALDQAKAGRLDLLDLMGKVLAAPRGHIRQQRPPDAHHPAAQGEDPRRHRQGRRHHPQHHRGQRLLSEHRRQRLLPGRRRHPGEAAGRPAR